MTSPFLRSGARALLALFLASSASAFAGTPEDEIVHFSTVGPDLYADGTVVLDGESYALVWSADGVFEGFSADGAPLDPADRVLIVAALAKNGRLPEGFFEVPASMARELQGGVYGIWMLDTRVQTPDGSVAPRPAVNNVPALVNAYGEVVDGRTTCGAKTAPGFRAMGADDSEPVVAAVAAQAPEGVEQPLVKAIRIDDDRAVLTVENLGGFVRVQGGATLEDIGRTVGPATEADGGDDLQIVAPDTKADSGFFRVIRSN